ncbi:hypothetical protein AB0D34_14780 [Streptomyces sp. NPDC048420]|uniref:hypothetical protein n=1 Tax=Streptomyces sp. NPDC048420 TaxID=3155755 RepID=UPI003429ECAE
MNLAPRTLIRAAVPALAAGMVLTAFTLPAAAQEPPGSWVIRSGNTVQLSARSGVANEVTIGINQADGHLIVEDQAGIGAFNGCRRLPNSTISADCGAGVTTLQISLGDLGDSLFILDSVTANASVSAGSGPDTVMTGGGNDSIVVRDGVRGNDSVNCDGNPTAGADQVVADPGDNVSLSCERRVSY